MSVTPWDASVYLRFATERTQPSIDLVARLPLDTPARTIDLGCGPGNSTAVLRRRYPSTALVGLDSSPDMLRDARASDSGVAWIEGDIASWAADQPFDIVFSNAALHWVPGHDRIFPRLLDQVALGGVLAVQMPRNYHRPDHIAAHELIASPEWSSRLGDLDRSVGDVPPPEYYYDLLAPQARGFSVWQTEYHHCLPDHGAMVDWMSGTLLRPMLERLDADERPRFLAAYRSKLERSFETRIDGTVLFPFLRIFLIAQR